MTTTAHEDQFTAATDRHIAQPYDVTAILRQNVADLGRELQRQRERADKAIAEAREELRGWIESRNDWMARAEKAEAELKEMREQEPVAYVKYKTTGSNVGLSWIAMPTDAYYPREGEQLYTRPIPAPAPTVPEGDDFNGTTPHMIQCIESLVDMSDRGVLVPHGLCGHSRTLLIASANRLRQQAAPAVPEEWRDVLAELAADLQASIEAEHAYRNQYSSIMRKYQNDMRIVERARALLQSGGGK